MVRIKKRGIRELFIHVHICDWYILIFFRHGRLEEQEGKVEGRVGGGGGEAWERVEGGEGERKGDEGEGGEKEQGKGKEETGKAEEDKGEGNAE